MPGHAIRVLFFASVAETAGTRDLDMEIAVGETLKELRTRLERDRPRLAGKLSKCAAAVNRTVVSDEHKLAGGDEIAFLPPVSGG